MKNKLKLFLGILIVFGLILQPSVILARGGGGHGGSYSSHSSHSSSAKIYSSSKSYSPNRVYSIGSPKKSSPSLSSSSKSVSKPSSKSTTIIVNKKTYNTGSRSSFHFWGTPYHYNYYHSWYSYSPYWYNPYYWFNPTPVVVTSGDFIVSFFVGLIVLLVAGYVIYRIVRRRY